MRPLGSVVTAASEAVTVTCQHREAICHAPLAGLCPQGPARKGPEGSNRGDPCSPSPADLEGSKDSDGSLLLCSYSAARQWPSQLNTGFWVWLASPRLSPRPRR